MKSQEENCVEEINALMNDLDITKDDAVEIINIYFECYADSWKDFLRDEVRIVKQTEENMNLIAELKTIDDACLFEGDDYVMITNYSTLQKMGEIGDCLSNHSF